MASKLIWVSPYEVENQLELSLRQAFDILEPKLRPPFSVTIPDPEEYVQLNRAIVYGVLCYPDLAKVYIRYLHALITDGYALYTSLLVGIVNELHCKLVDCAKSQLIWVTKEMIHVSAVGIDGLLVSLLRRIVGGDYGDENVWLCSELASLFLGKWDCLLEDDPLVLTSALYSFLRLLGDHCRFLGIAKLENVRRMESEFCVRMFREQLHLCLKIGRDLLRLLQDVLYIPEFGEIWMDLVLNPCSFRTPGFSDISQIYQSRTSSRYFLLRITPEMETQLRFLLTYVKLGSQMRHQTWFWRKFLSRPEKETILIDIVRFICCAHHPSNKIIQSDVIPRWAVIGWLLKLCRTNYIEHNVKLALFYDWLFFDERADNIMNVEPAILLMVCSVPQYLDITQSLLGFLFRLVDNYDTNRRDMVIRGVSSAFKEVVRKGVISSLDILVTCPGLAPYLKENLVRFLTSHSEGVPLNLLPVNVLSLTPQKHHPSQAKENECGTEAVDIPVPMSDNSCLSPCPSVQNSGQTQADSLQSLVQSLGESLKQSSTKALQSLENVLLSFIRLDNQRG
ncbi:PREDICTED: integrator complex subunit 3 isoform X2 [Tarenaya hassleriana]|nr:PREDICTED: integrator complex subunit 3 isoform X2 [Tarenaya hassleriana]